MSPAVILPYMFNTLPITAYRSLEIVVPFTDTDTGCVCAFIVIVPVSEDNITSLPNVTAVTFKSLSETVNVEPPIVVDIVIAS